MAFAAKIEQLTFVNESFDLHLTQDVFEHLYIIRSQQSNLDGKPLFDVYLTL
jgi:hypothetical protein